MLSICNQLLSLYLTILYPVEAVSSSSRTMALLPARRVPLGDATNRMQSYSNGTVTPSPVRMVVCSPVPPKLRSLVMRKREEEAEAEEDAEKLPQTNSSCSTTKETLKATNTSMDQENKLCSLQVRNDDTLQEVVEGVKTPMPPPSSASTSLSPRRQLRVNTRSPLPSSSSSSSSSLPMLITTSPSAELETREGRERSMTPELNKIATPHTYTSCRKGSYSFSSAERRLTLTPLSVGSHRSRSSELSSIGSPSPMKASESTLSLSSHSSMRSTGGVFLLHGVRRGRGVSTRSPGSSSSLQSPNIVFKSTFPCVGKFTSNSSAINGTSARIVSKPTMLFSKF